MAMTRGFTERWGAEIALLVTLGSLLFALAPGATWARDAPARECRLAPDAWTPALDQVREYVEEQANTETNASQRRLTQTSQTLADLGDAQLFIVYVRLMQTLDATAQAELFAEQTRWLEKRAAAARAAVTSTGGTLEPLEYSGAFGKITQERIAELHKRLQQHGRSPEERKERRTP